jgi:hypothetical protein
MAPHSVTQKKTLEALEKGGGYVSETAKLLQIKQGTLRKRIERNAVLKQAQADILERRIDVAESKLMTAIDNHNITAIIFFLKCQAKSRGYIDHPNAQAQTGQINHLHEILAAFRAGPIKRGEYAPDVADKSPEA